MDGTIVWWGALLISIGAILIGMVIGFFLARWVFTRQLKKNPPINANMIRAMYTQMGRKPSESQVRAVINAMRQHQS